MFGKGCRKKKNGLPVVLLGLVEVLFHAIRANVEVAWHASMYFAARLDLGIADVALTVIISDLSTQCVALRTLCHIESEERTYVTCLRHSWSCQRGRGFPLERETQVLARRYAWQVL